MGKRGDKSEQDGAGPYDPKKAVDPTKTGGGGKHSGDKGGSGKK